MRNPRHEFRSSDGTMTVNCPWLHPPRIQDGRELSAPPCEPVARIAIYDGELPPAARVRRPWTNGAATMRLRSALHHFPVIWEHIHPRGVHRHIRHVPVALRSNKTFEGFCGGEDGHRYPRAHVQDIAADR